MGEKKPPSRKRYEGNNPNWTARLPVELRDEITALLMNTGQSRRDFMVISLKKQVADYEIARMQGYNKGFDSGYKKGHDEGYEEGEERGYIKGHHEGYVKGEKEGYIDGHNIGFSKGRQVGNLWSRWYMLNLDLKIINRLFVTLLLADNEVDRKNN